MILTDFTLLRLPPANDTSLVTGFTCELQKSNNAKHSTLGKCSFKKVCNETNEQWQCATKKQPEANWVFGVKNCPPCSFPGLVQLLKTPLSAEMQWWVFLCGRKDQVLLQGNYNGHIPTLLRIQWLLSSGDAQTINPDWIYKGIFRCWKKKIWIWGFPKVCLFGLYEHIWVGGRIELLIFLSKEAGLSQLLLVPWNTPFD